jgi:hypothetical protein
MGKRVDVVIAGLTVKPTMAGLAPKGIKLRDCWRKGPNLKVSVWFSPLHKGAGALWAVRGSAELINFDGTADLPRPLLSKEGRCAMTPPESL